MNPNPAGRPRGCADQPAGDNSLAHQPSRRRPDGGLPGRRIACPTNQASIPGGGFAAGRPRGHDDGPSARLFFPQAAGIGRVLLPLLACWAACCAARGACLIGGTVRDSETGKPVDRVRVFARPPAPSPGTPAKPAILRVTGADGGFCFDSLGPGVYRLVADHAGYLVSLYGAPPGHTEGATPFTVNGRDPLPPVVVRMVAAASISGTVLDDRGQPVDDVMVDVQRKGWDLVWQPYHVTFTETGPGGTFRISPLPPGSYYLKVSPPDLPYSEPELHEDGTISPSTVSSVLDAGGRPVAVTSSLTYYSGSYTFAHATPVTVKAGQEIDNVVLAMKPRISRRITGRVAVAADPKAFANASVQVNRAIDIGPPGMNVFWPISPDGAFSIADLGPEEFELTVDGLPGVISAKVDVSNGDAEGVILEPLHTAEIHLTARVEGGAPAAASLALCNIERECGEPAEPDAKGVYRFGNLRQGLYRFRSRTAGLYVKSVAVEGQPLGDAPLDLRKGAPESIVVVLGTDLASLEGRLEPQEQRTAGLGVSVLLVNEIRFTPEVSNNFLAADQAGHFRFDAVMPGRYRVLAIEGFDDGPWGSPELFGLLRDKSVAVEIRGGETHSVTAPVVPVAEWEAALRKLGM